MNNHAFTVQELVEILKTFPADMPVLVSGYETGYECFYQPFVAGVVHNPENMHWDGEYQLPETGEPTALSALILERLRRDD